ncbi:hypothetical protein BRARA_I04978 [Brassica rapa]|uniref:valine--tRNA ligase n=1 Tax=Brassica campestris TaxID=3711 RepID=A0A397Y6T1_BRACM|nr:hypothetical protein BRARA_I04978 [Brassica rapa]
MSLLFLTRAKPLFLSRYLSSFLSPAPTNLLRRSFHGSATMSEAEKKILTEEELERKKKKDDKAKEKELKKLKALEKAKLAELKAKQAKDGTSAPKKSAKKSSKRDASDENPADFVDPETPLGDKKRLSSQMAKQYSPAAVEKSWYAWWEKSDLFKADAKSSKPPFVIVLPPPNVTGALHIGHALTSAIEDTIIRWKRMSGYNALWVPGMDHAGIATQVVVEKKLMRERGLTRHDVGREEFVNEVWKWKNQHGGTILTQLRRLGASLDWSRECFTMDEQRSKAVTEGFVRLYKEGLIYRDIRLVNWDCVLRTAVSDVEVEHIDIKEKTLLNVPGYDKPVEFGLLTSFAYPLEGGLGEVVVATTRVETMLGDTAIAIHPDDARYKHLHGKFAVHPFNGRKIPIICDGILVDPNFGTGCVKITPAHDPNDCEVGKQGQVKDFPNGISECGADALRFALVSYTAQSDKINLDILRVVGYRQWCNKLWNAVRFAMMRLGDDYSPPLTLSPETMPFSCQWILSVLNKAIAKTVESLNAFEFSDAANTVYAWWQYQFCDVYIEAIKPYFAGDNPAFASERAHAQHALWVSLETGLRLLHPLMPFVTEELWQRLPSPKNTERKASIMICDYPSAIENWTNEKVETEMETVLASVKCLRALRAGLMEKQKNERLPAFAVCENNVTSEIVKSHELEIRTLANLSSLEVLLKGEHAAPPGSAVETVNENLKVYLKVNRAINTEAEQEKIRNKIDELQKQKEKLQKVMSASGYEEKVPANIKEDNATKLAKILQEFDFFEKENARLVAETGNEQ